MQKESSHINYSRGFSLVEIVVSAGLLLLLATLLVGAITYGQEGAEIAGAHDRASFIAEEGIEAVRALRDQSFSNLTNGTFGISTSSGVWSLSGTSDTQDIFTRSVTIAAVDSVTKQVTSTVTWSENALRTGSVSIVTYLTNIQLLFRQANSLNASTSGAMLSGKNLTGITLQNIGSSTIAISSITPSWQSATAKIQNIVINGTTVWTGTQNSGTTLPISTVTLNAGSGVIPITRMQFSGNLTGNSLIIIFTMTDGSTKTATTTAL